MLKKLITSAVRTQFKGGSQGEWLRNSLLFALISLVACPTTMGTRTLAQENEPKRIETEFQQGDETYPASILLDRVAVVLTEKALETSKIYERMIRLLDGKPVEGLSRNVIGIDVPDADSIAKLKAHISALLDELDERAGDLSEFIADTGLLVTVAASETPRVMPDRIIVWIDVDRDPGFIKGILKEFDAELVGRNPFNPRSFVIRTPADNTLEISNIINSHTGVRFALPDFYVPGGFRQASVIPDDEFFAFQWHLRNGGDGFGTEDADIDADLAWPSGMGSSDILIAVIDSGIEPDHPDLADAVWTNPGETANNCDDDGNGYVDDVHGWDFVSCPSLLEPSASCPNLSRGDDPLLRCGDNDVTPIGLPKSTHGTGVAGAAVARVLNGASQVSGHHEGVVGVCPYCSLLPIRVSVNGLPHYTHELAIDYARSMGADVINISWGYNQNEVVPMNIEAVLDNAADAGAVIFVATSNDSHENCNPDPPGQPDLSAHPKVIAVAGSTNEDLVSPGGFGRCLSVLAPTDGGTLRAATTDLKLSWGYNYHDQTFTSDCRNPEHNRAYTFCFGGLSFSAPLAAGVAGLVLSHDDSLTWMDVKRLLQDTADKISDTVAKYSVETGYTAPANGNPLKYGRGRINAFEAVRVVADPIFGRGGVDIFVRDNRLDWGNTQQPSSVTFEKNRGSIPYWQSVDIKIDAPPFRTSPPENPDELSCLNSAAPQTQTNEAGGSVEAPQTSVEFGCFAHEDIMPGVLNKIYVRAHNRGVKSATNVQVELLWAVHAGIDPPALPGDFWSAFASHMDASDTSTWHPLSTQTVASLPYSGASVAGSEDDASAVLALDFNAPVFDQDYPDADHFTLLAILDSQDDPVSPDTTLSHEPSFITPRDNNVTQLTIPLGGQIAESTDQHFGVQARQSERRLSKAYYRRARWYFAQPKC